MRNRKFICFIILSIFILSFIPFDNSDLALAFDGDAYENYTIYDENGDLVCEKSSIEVGDTFITREFYEYEIISIENHKGQAKLVRKIEPPTIKREHFIRNDKMAERGQLSKKICLYLTHNDESYLPSDGYDSIYGKGGVHDVANMFKEELINKNIEVVLDETLHIPHDSSAYTRSAVTAQKLLNNQRPDAMFDVHRDGVSRSFYYVNDGNKDYSKIRIVVGKSNPNFDENYAFAQTVFSIGNSMYPWLFSDIYCGKGHYNQALQPTDLLFEMGTYLIEKEYVYNTLPLLATVIDTALYASNTDENGDIIVDEQSPETNQTPTVISPPNPNSTNGENDNQVVASANGWIGAMIVSIIIAIGLILGGIILKKQEKTNKKDKKV